MAEARCYLELGEYSTAIRRFQEGMNVLRSRIQQYVELTLTSNPAIYLQPELKGIVDLRRLTKIYSWMDPTLSESDVFEMHRENFAYFVRNPDKYINSIPKSMLIDVEDKNFFSKYLPNFYLPNFLARAESMKDFSKYLPNFLAKAESMIETNQRFESYEIEVKAMSQLEMNFHEWQQLTPSEPATEDTSVMLIIPSTPVAV